MITQLGLAPGSQFSLCEPFLCDAHGKKPNKTYCLLSAVCVGCCAVPASLRGTGGVADPAESGPGRVKPAVPGTAGFVLDCTGETWYHQLLLPSSRQNLISPKRLL